MCTNTFILVLLFIVKILVFLIPIGIYILKRNNILDEYIKYFYLGEVLFLVLLISLCIFGSDCIKNSSISGIKLNYKLFDNVNYIDEETTAINYKSINPSKVYKNNYNVSVNYYNINLYPLRNIKIDCDKESFFQNYGNDIAALATVVSTVKQTDTNPYDILEYVMRSGLLSCEKQISSNELISLITDLYGVNARSISSSELTSNINDGKIILAKTHATDDNINLSCGEQLIVIYSINSKNEFSILNPSDRINDYFCSSNTKGYGTVVRGNQNSITFDINELSNSISEYYVIEVN